MARRPAPPVPRCAPGRAAISGLALIGMIALIGVLGPTTVSAQDDISVFSSRPDSVAVTIYPDDLALITETRTVELPATAATLVIRDVADTLLPQSAVVNGLARPLAESNFDFNRLSPQSLLRQAVGRTVTLLRTNPATGAVSRLPAVVRSAGEGVVLETADGTEALYCAGLPEGIVFDAVPDDLYATPQLSMRLAAGDPGRRTFTVSYLAHGFEWSADYVARFDPGHEQMALTGWATVSNATGTSFAQTELQLVAGKLNVLPEDEGGSRAEPVATEDDESAADARERLAEQETQADAMLLRECFDAEVPSFERRASEPDPGLDYIIVTGARIRREEFGDYHLYRLPWMTDLLAQQTKQLKFLELDKVRIERFYRIFAADIRTPVIYGSNMDLVADDDGSARISAHQASIVVRTANTVANGLGEPLPAGGLLFFDVVDGRSIFVGRSRLDDLPVGGEFDREHAHANDVLVEGEFRVTEDSRWRVAAELYIRNGKSQPIAVEVLHSLLGEPDFAVDESSDPYEIVGERVVWQLEVPPGGSQLRYRLSRALR